MMFTIRIVVPRNMSASRICQYACRPQPKTVSVRTFVRFAKRQEEASAVRNAVRVCAWRIPRGLPSGEYSVNDPVGLMTGSEGFASGEETVTTMYVRQLY